MKTMGRLCVVLVVLMATLWAGGLVTNTNQSAVFIRTLNRNASTQVDAAYFNPAGMTKLADGLYVDLANQCIWQEKTITNDYTYLHENEFVGKVQVLTFPTAHVVWKKNKLAVGASVMPIGGGGSATYDKGLPSFEVPVSNLVPQLKVDDYSLNTNFEGSSIYMGFQASAAYKVNEMLSLAVGGRYISASNKYNGYLKGISVLASGNWVTPPQYLTAMVANLTSAANSLQPIINAGAGSYTLAQLQADGYITADQYNQLAAGLTSIGVTDPANTPAAVAQNAFTTAANTTNAQIPYVSAQTADKEVDAKRTGSAIGWIVGVNLSPFKGLDVGVRYETITKLEMKNDTKKDDTGLFPDGAKYSSDIPGMLGIGLAYQITPSLKIMSDFNYFFNEGVDWDGAEVNFDNGYEVGAGFEMALTKKLKVSAGYLMSVQGATDAAQSDMDFNLDCSTVGAGIVYCLKPGLEVNLGALNTFYKEGKNAAGNEKYKQTTTALGFGVQVKL